MSLKIYQDTLSDVTILSNRFIDEYMADANDAQLKIYLFLLRTIHSGKSTSISHIADYFNFTEKDVLRAIKYWEKKSLLQIDYDADKNPEGIHICALNSSAPHQAPKEVKKETISIASESLKADSKDFEKPAYTLDELKAFKTNEKTSQILFITEQYLRKPLSPNEAKTMLFISDKLSFSADLIDYLIQYCVERGKKEMRYIEKVAINWAEEGIKTAEQAANYIHKYDKSVYQIMNMLGKTNAPTKTEATYIKKWMDTYGFDQSVIAYACEKTVLATDSNRIKYADGILSNWYQAGVKCLKDVMKQTPPSKQTMTNNYSNKFNQFQQNNYDYDALEKKLVKNI